ncbi:MAG: AGE family epimerase/isomerase [Treponema sp.]|nr:AGE family epimerase/isomerase [Treponema sp.]
MFGKQEAIQMVRENILPFWQNMADAEHGGFYGEADFYGKINKVADKGCILNSRILWTFSAAYRLFNDDAYKAYAGQARDFLYAAFFDKEHGGLYWLVDNTGSPVQTRKQFYNIAFGIYALSEHHLATGDLSSLELAESLYDVMEKYGYDPEQGGYIEACSRDWKNADDFRLSRKDLNSPKSMNTNLHVLEAYTTLAIASKNENVKKSLESLLRVTLEKIINKKWHFELFFDMNWNSLSKEVSWGHDIEGSWLIYEAALAVGSEDLIFRVKDTAIEIANNIYSKALDYNNGGFLSGLNEKGNVLQKKEWWPQAEAVVGFYNAYLLTGGQKYLNASSSIWEYIKNCFLDSERGEWHNELDDRNVPDTKMPKAGFWKCPYHNARACFEIIRRN